MGHESAMPFGTLRHASQHSGPYDATTEAHQPDSSAPGRSAFFSLVFFVPRAKKSDRQPPQGDVVWHLGATANTAKSKPNQAIRAQCAALGPPNHLRPQNPKTPKPQNLPKHLPNHPPNLMP